MPPMRMAKGEEGRDPGRSAGVIPACEPAVVEHMNLVEQLGRCRVAWKPDTSGEERFRLEEVAVFIVDCGGQLVDFRGRRAINSRVGHNSTCRQRKQSNQAGKHPHKKLGPTATHAKV